MESSPNKDSLSETQVGEGSYITVDPLDGTKAFIRRQSHGVGTMVAMVEEGQVVSAYVGDVNTQEIYGFPSRLHECPPHYGIRDGRPLRVREEATTGSKYPSTRSARCAFEKGIVDISFDRLVCVS